MKAAIISKWGGPEVLQIGEVSRPEPKSGEILIRVRAFGLNHAESYFRQGLWGDVAKITGIECAGEVELDPTGRFKKGQQVVAIVGGLGRDLNGSYAEYTVARATNVLAVDKKNLSWEELAALPEVYTTAWWCLNQNAQLKSGQTLVVRGGSSSLGQAAINIAKSTGVRVIATVSKESSIAHLKNIGADHVLIEKSDLSEKVRTLFPQGVDVVYDLVGATVLKDSLKMVRPYGHVCMAGFLGGLVPVDQFNPLVDLPSGVALSFFGSAFVLGTKEFPLEKTPMQTFIDHASHGVYKAKPARIFDFAEIVKAHELMESGNAGGKIVVKMT